MADLNDAPTLIITIGIIAILLGVMASVLTSFQAGIIKDSDYATVEENNVTFTAGYAPLSTPECNAVIAVEVP